MAQGFRRCAKYSSRRRFLTASLACAAVSWVRRLWRAWGLLILAFSQRIELKFAVFVP